MIVTSQLAAESASYREVVAAGDFWMESLKTGQTLRILDLEGNQAADTLFYSLEDPHERYSAMDTIREQGNIYLTAGSTLLSNRGNPLLDIVRIPVGVTTLWEGPARQSRIRFAMRWKKVHARLP